MTEVLAGDASALRRELKAHHLFALSFGTIIGTGWIVGVGLWLEMAGAFGSILGFALGGFVMILIAICYSQLAVRYPQAGGEISYAYHMWGIDTAFVCGWFMVFSYVTTISFQAVVLGWMFDVLAPSLRGPILYTVLESPIYLTPNLVSIAVGVLIVFLNSREVRAMAQFQSWLTFGKIILSLIFFSGALFYGNADNLVPKWSANATDFSWVGIFAVFATAPFFLAGFDVVPLAMGEKSTTTTSRAVHVAVIGSLVAAVAYYALVILSVSAAMPRSDLLQSPLPAIAAFEHVLGSPFLAKLALVAGLMGVFSSWNASVYAGSRVLYALGDSRLVPGWFSKLDETSGTPVQAVLFASVVGLLLLPFGKAVIYPIITASGFCLVLVAVFISFGLLRLHLTGANTDGPHIPGGVVTIIGACAASVFVTGLGFYEAWRAADRGSIPIEWIIFSVWTGLGAIFWFCTRSERALISDEQRRWRLLGTAE